MQKMFRVLMKITKRLIIFLSFTTVNIECEIPVTGRCSRPALPAKAWKHFISPEKNRFNNKEKVYILCKYDEFPLLKHIIECRNGRWIGKQARCGRHMEAQVIKLDIHDCQASNNQLSVLQPLNQRNKTAPGFDHVQPNSDHSLRVPQGMTTPTIGSNCYTFRIKFDKKVQIWFLLTEFRTISTEENITLNVSPFVSKYRDCVLHEQTKGYSLGAVFNNIFICDLKNDSDYEKEQLDVSDNISITIKTNFDEEFRLDAIFIGEIFTTTSSNGNVSPDCGELEITNVGVDIQIESTHTYVMCNDSFIDISGQNIKSLDTNKNPKHKFTCNWNGLWVGDWPVCLPKMTCPIESIIVGLDRTVRIEEIANVYYLVESKWYAINDSYIRYVCVNENDIMVGQSIRTCMKNGQWSSKTSYCMRPGISGLAIAGILMVTFIVIVLIVVILVIVIRRMHSKNIKPQLRLTQNKVEETIENRYSDEFYDDIKQSEGFYEEVMAEIHTYESIHYQAIDESIDQANHNEPPVYIIITNTQ